MPPDDESRKRLLLPSPQPPDSPTEVNTPSTPSTLSPSPSPIRPTYFTHASSPGRTERDGLAHLEHELRGASDDVIRELLIRLGRKHLLALSENMHGDLPFASEEVSFAKVEMIEGRLRRYIDEIIEGRLKSHVDKIVDSAVSECRDQIFDEFQTNKAEFCEQVDDSKCELRILANECMEDMKEQAQGHQYEMEEQAQQYMNDIQGRGIEVEMSAEKKVAKLKCLFNGSEQSVLNRKSIDTNARRNSI